MLGYNKDQEGEQELTAKYKEYIGTFKVIVENKATEKIFKIGTIETKKLEEKIIKKVTH